MTEDFFDDAEREFGDLLFRLSSPQDPKMGRAGALALRAVREGHSCLTPLDTDLREALLRQKHLASRNPADRTPLVLRGDRLYLHKYLCYEREIAAAIRERRALPDLPAVAAEKAHRYFAAAPEGEQTRAAHLALTRPFAVITGGPGTGKTTVIAAILALELTRAPELSIALAAPTGKAKARLAEAIAGEIPNLLLPARERLHNLSIQTLHRLLGFRPDAAEPKHNQENPLDADLVILDEASMVSLPLMARLVRALKPGARLLLLGDPNQLSSVETGSVLADICRSSVQLDIARLTINHRARENKELVECSEALINASQLLDVQTEKFRSAPLPPPQELRAALAHRLRGWGLSDWKNAASPKEAFAYARKAKILAGMREGLYGVGNLNALCADILELPPEADGAPVMILANDRRTGLNNGDIGVRWRGRVYFEEPDRSFLPEELPIHEPVFAMTVHKSQGSGFDDVLLLLGPGDNPVLTRELLYTGMTRTRRRFELWTPEELLQKVIQRPTVRYSGLSEELEGKIV